jgi:N-acetylglucosaminyl-diphospho-decaprenol L-rhamnosyltransferase
MRADVAILIVTYNSERQIADCLQSVFEQRRAVSQQVIVVDNASADGTVTQIREKFPAAQLVLPGRNLGFAAGVNLAAKHAAADYVLLLNPDTVVVDHAIDVLVEFARAHPDYGLYGGRTLKPDGSLEPSSCWGLPSLWSLTMFACGLSTFARGNRLFDPESLGSWPRDTVRKVGVITGCLLLARREAWDRLGGMDERYFLYGEDADFSMRAHRAGYHPVICPSARIIHEVGQSSATPTHKLLMLYRGKACFFRTHYSGLLLRLALVLLVFGVGLRVVLAKLRPAQSGRASNDWAALWRARHDWLPGYPAKS